MNLTLLIQPGQTLYLSLIIEQRDGTKRTLMCQPIIATVDEPPPLIDAKGA